MGWKEATRTGGFESKTALLAARFEVWGSDEVEGAGAGDRIGRWDGTFKGIRSRYATYYLQQLCTDSCW